MGKSDRIRLSDVRAIYHLLGECYELGSDLLLWRAHMLQRLSHILGAQVAVCINVLPAAEGADLRLLPETFLDYGWANQADRALYLKWMNETPPHHDPLIAYWADRVPGRRASLTCRRRNVLASHEWYGSALYNDFYRPAGMDDELQSLVWRPRAKSIDGLRLIRYRKAGAFNRRQEKLLRIFHREICRCLGRQLADVFGPTITTLSPRMRQVLACLLEGESEKQAAARLGVSRHTIHEHVKRLHKHFGVASRGELLCKCSKLLPALHRLAADAVANNAPSPVTQFSEAFRIIGGS
jgi:DNA-binding CsgD family transcriptional regulator